MIAPREILREAWRNAYAGVTHPMISMLVFVVVIGGLGAVQAFSVVQVNRDAEHWRAIGASTQIVQLAGRIDGARCDGLSKVPGIAASGAVREGPSLQLAALPSTTFSTFEGTPGLANVLGVRKSEDTVRTGTWVSSDLAETLGISMSSALRLDTVEGNSIGVSGEYNYPEDGRMPTLAYNVVSEVPSTGTFDSCWVELWPEDGALGALLTFPVSVNGLGADDSTPKIQQLNASEGPTFNGPARLERIPSWLFLGAGVLSGVSIGFTLTWVRRLELASALHAGISKISLCLQLMTESILSAVPAVFLSLSAVLLLVTTDNPGSPWPAYLVGAGVVISGFVAVLLGAVTSTLMVSEDRLFQYFKTR